MGPCGTLVTLQYNRNQMDVLQGLAVIEFHSYVATVKRCSALCHLINEMYTEASDVE